MILRRTTTLFGTPSCSKERSAVWWMAMNDPKCTDCVLPWSSMYTPWRRERTAACCSKTTLLIRYGGYQLLPICKPRNGVVAYLERVGCHGSIDGNFRHFELMWCWVKIEVGGGVSWWWVRSEVYIVSSDESSFGVEWVFLTSIRTAGVHTCDGGAMAATIRLRSESQKHFKM